MDIRKAQRAEFEAYDKEAAEEELKKLDRNLFWVPVVVFRKVTAYGFPGMANIPASLMTQHEDIQCWHDGKWLPFPKDKVEKQKIKEQQEADRAVYGRDS